MLCIMINIDIILLILLITGILGNKREREREKWQDNFTSTSFQILKKPVFEF